MLLGILTALIAHVRGFSPLRWLLSLGPIGLIAVFLCRSAASKNLEGDERASRKRRAGIVGATLCWIHILYIVSIGVVGLALNQEESPGYQGAVELSDEMSALDGRIDSLQRILGFYEQRMVASNSMMTRLDSTISNTEQMYPNGIPESRYAKYEEEIERYNSLLKELQSETADYYELRETCSLLIDSFNLKLLLD